MFSFILRVISSLSVVSFDAQKFSNFDEIQIIFYFVSCAFSVI